MDNETYLGILNNNLNLNRGDLHLGVRLSDNGEKSTQRIIAKILTKNYYGGKQLSVLNRADKLSEYGVPQSRAHAKQQLDADVKKKKENVIYELAKINGYKKVFGDDKEKSTKVPHSGYKFKGKGEFEYNLSCDLAVTGRKWLSGLVFVTTFRRNF